MTRNLFKRVLNLMSALLILSFGIPAAADTGNKYRFNEDFGNWVTLGGINEWDGIKANTRAETEELEVKLAENGYILISGENMNISMEDYTTFCNGHSFWFSKYMNQQEPGWSLYRVYVYEPSYTDFMAQLSDEIKDLQRYTIQELTESTVVINYMYWDLDEAVGTISDKFNDNIPEYSESGYIQIVSPVDCEVTILQAYTRQYYQFYVKKNQPLLVKVVTGCYHITDVNKQTVNDNINNSGENTLPYNNQIQIGTHNTEDNPYIIELNGLVEKYNIPDIDIDGKPDYSLNTTTETFTDTDIPEKQTEIHNNSNTEDNNHSDEHLFLWIILIAIAIIGIIWVVVQFRRENHDDEQND